MNLWISIISFASVLMLLCCKTVLSTSRDCSSTQECVMSLNTTGSGCLVDCTHRSPLETKLLHIPSNLPISTTVLNCEDNQISVINAEPFTSLTKLQHLQLAFNNISNISAINVQSLITYELQHNLITVINKQMFKGLKNLTSLILSNNLITLIEKGSFDDLINLERLDLMKNELLFEPSYSVPHGLFGNLIHMKWLFLHDNSEPDYRGDLVANLTQLEELHLDGPSKSDASFPGQFLGLTKLKKLIVYGEVQYVTNSTFFNLSLCPITTFALASKKLIDLEPGALAPFTSLTTLALSGNVNLSLCNASHAWNGLNHATNFSQLYLEQVMDVYTNKALLPCNFFEGLNAWIRNNIKTLYLDKNSLVQIDKQLTQLQNLTTICLNNNRMQKIKKIICQENASLFSDGFILPCYSGCDNESKITNQPSEDGILYLPATIKNIKLSNAINYDLNPMPKLEIQGCDSLELLEMNHNTIGDFSGPITFTGTPNTSGVTVNLTGNYAKVFHPNFITDHRVKTLDLTGNSLGQTLWEDKEGKAFKHFYQLEALNISANWIKSLPPNIFWNLTNLRVLRLCDNALSSLKIPFSNLTNLRELDLRGNIFVSLSKNETDSLDAHGDLSINLESNPLVCSCDNLEFLAWLKDFDGKTKKPRYNFFQCHYHYHNFSYVHLGWFFENQWDIFHRNCYSRHYLIVSCSCFAVMSVSLTLSIAIYKHKWDIKFFCTKLIYRKGWKELSHDPHVHEYDAFVAYHQDDLQWVRFQLLQKLEDENVATASSSLDSSITRPLRLCVHHRDFVPGIIIEENILESIQRSNKTIIVLSQSFVESGWCQFELQMAKLNTFEEKKNNIVVVVLEPVPLRLMNQSLQLLLRKTTFIEWPFSPVHRNDFWERLRKSLIGPDVTSLCDCGHPIRSAWRPGLQENSI